MKTMHTKRYYKDNWDRLIAQTNSPHYFNFEAELEEMAEPLKDTLSGDLLLAAKNALARIVWERGMELIRKDMRAVKDLESGQASLGYTTHNQEITAGYELRERLEFNYFQALYFKEKWGI